MSEVTHGSVVVELVALAQRRLGMPAVKVVLEELVPLFSTVWVDQILHDRAVSAMLASGSRGISLVDWTSFEVMRRRAIELAFAFDGGFQREVSSRSPATSPRARVAPTSHRRTAATPFRAFLLGRGWARFR